MKNPTVIFLSAFCVAALSGLATILRSPKRLTRKDLFSATLNAGMLGLGICLTWYSKFSTGEDDVYMLLGICLISGLAGVSVMDFIVEAVKAGGVTIKLSPKKKVEDQESTQ